MWISFIVDFYLGFIGIKGDGGEKINPDSNLWRRKFEREI